MSQSVFAEYTGHTPEAAEERYQGRQKSWTTGRNLRKSLNFNTTECTFLETFCVCSWDPIFGPRLGWSGKCRVLMKWKVATPHMLCVGLSLCLAFPESNSIHRSPGQTRHIHWGRERISDANLLPSGD